jgi:hypothetical protein
VQIRCDHSGWRKIGGALGIKFARTQMQRNATGLKSIEENEIVWGFTRESTEIRSPVFHHDMLTFIRNNPKEATSDVDHY